MSIASNSPRVFLAALLLHAFVLHHSAEGSISEGFPGDGLPSLFYNSTDGEIVLDMEGKLATAYSLQSQTQVFTGDAPTFTGSTVFVTDTDHLIQETILSPPLGPGLHNLGRVAQPGLSQQFLLSDLTTLGTLLEGGRGLEFDLVYVPEPSAACLALASAAALAAYHRTRHRAAGQRRQSA